MKTKHIFCALMSATLMFAFGSCSEEHELHSPSLALGIEWPAGIDDDEEGKGVDVWIFNSEGTMQEHNEYADAAGASSGLTLLPNGKYTIIVTSGLGNAFSTIGTGLNDLMIKMTDPSSSPEQVYYGETEVSMNGKSISQEMIDMQPMLATLTINVTGVPVGAVLNTEVHCVAEGFYPGRLAADGKTHGVPSSDSTIVNMPAATAGADSLITSGPIMLMPTSIDYETMRFHFTLTLANGQKTEIDADAPRMDAGGTYVINMTYSQLMPYIHFHYVTLDEWTEGEVISEGEGEAL